MVEFSVEHVLLFVVIAFLLYHLMGSCGCGNGVIDGFSVGGLNCDKFTRIDKSNCSDITNEILCHKHKYISRNPETRQYTDYRCLWGGDEKCNAMTNYMSMCDPPKPMGGCKGTQYGCCIDSVTPASSEIDECKRTHKCSNALKICTKKCEYSKNHKRCMNNCFKDHRNNCKKTCNIYKNNNKKKNECKKKCNQDCKPFIPIPRTDGGDEGACFEGTLNETGGMPGGKCLDKDECCSVSGYCGKDDDYCLKGYCDNSSECGSYTCSDHTCQRI